MMKQVDIDFINGLIGLPHEKGAAGPCSFDCWGLLIHVGECLFDWQLPADVRPHEMALREIADALINHPERSNWRVIDGPEHGAGVRMSRIDQPDHVGLWLDIDRGGVLHCAEGMGVCFDDMASLKAGGWSRFEFMRRT